MKRLDRVMANHDEVQRGISVKLQTVSVEVKEGRLDMLKLEHSVQGKVVERLPHWQCALHLH